MVTSSFQQYALRSHCEIRSTGKHGFFISSFTLAYCRKTENLNQSANEEPSSITMERLKANDSSSLVQFIYEIFNITEITETHCKM